MASCGSLSMLFPTAPPATLPTLAEPASLALRSLPTALVLGVWLLVERRAAPRASRGWRIAVVGVGALTTVAQCILVWHVAAELDCDGVGGAAAWGVALVVASALFNSVMLCAVAACAARVAVAVFTLDSVGAIIADWAVREGWIVPASRAAHSFTAIQHTACVLALCALNVVVPRRTRVAAAARTATKTTPAPKQLTVSDALTRRTPQASPARVTSTWSLFA